MDDASSKAGAPTTLARFYASESAFGVILEPRILGSGVPTMSQSGAADKLSRSAGGGATDGHVAWPAPQALAAVAAARLLSR